MSLPLDGILVVALEQAVAEAHSDLAAGLEQSGMDQARRSLRLVVEDLRYSWPAADDFEQCAKLLPCEYTHPGHLVGHRPRLSQRQYHHRKTTDYCQAKGHQHRTDRLQPQR